MEIAYRQIAQNGLEGFRIRQVAAEAGIDNRTLHYHFPSKDALILGVVDSLIDDLKNNRIASKGAEPTATPFARTIMVALRGIGYQARLPPRRVDELLSELAAQTKHWITVEKHSQ